MLLPHFSRTLLNGSVIGSIMLLGGCASGPAPQVIDTAAADQPSAQSLETVQALTQLSNLEEELKQLRNAVEEMQFDQENADRRQQDLYQDIDRRLLALEQASSAANQDVVDRPLTPSERVLAEGQTGATLGTDGSISTDGGNSDPDVRASLPPGSVDGTGSTSVSLTEQQAYDNAFDSLKQSRYEDAIEEFQALVNTWPDSELADDALYWMSEANYVNREFEVALNGFRDLTERYPDSSRVPEAMLKVGYIQYDIGAYDEAAATFQEILSRFPGHQVTVSAETRLRRIQQTIQ